MSQCCLGDMLARGLAFGVASPKMAMIVVVVETSTCVVDRRTVKKAHGLVDRSSTNKPLIYTTQQ